MTETRKGKQRKTFEPPSPPPYEAPPKWIPSHERWNHPNYNSNLITYLPRTVYMERNEHRPLGFNIRGGKANEYGVYVSKVLPDSEADKLGLKAGDKILYVNKIDFCDIPHADAVDLLQESDILEMKVQYFPYGFSLQQQRIGLV
uniref:PDZ domain-containing protein 11-like n=1 Tax=Phallusia mammillata TaxID=59560 RepID=A0A6F9DP61_9ASCI|nr:PDZ domain-containing protein 11-like [Phallusia mammillata]